MTYKVRIETVTTTAITAAAGVATVAPDGTHVVLVSAKVLPFGGPVPGAAADNAVRVITVWSTAS